MSLAPPSSISETLSSISLQGSRERLVAKDRIEWMSLENCESEENPKLRQVGALHRGFARREGFADSIEASPGSGPVLGRHVEHRLDLDGAEGPSSWDRPL